MVEGVHFRKEWGGFESVGYRIVARNISDVFAMGGNPSFFFLSAALGSHYQQEDLHAFYKGLSAASRRFRVSLCGGDTGQSPGPTFYAGFCVGTAKKPIFRSTSRPGDTLWVSGPLGASFAGWLCLRDGIQGYPSLIKRHLFPPLPYRLAPALSQFASSMIDISDGLSSDVTRLHEESENGFRIDLWRLKIPGSVRKLARQYGENPSDWALKSGEEYELLFTLPPSKERDFQRFLLRHRLKSVHCIGVVLKKGEKVYLRRTEGEKAELLSETGWEHHIGR